MPNPELRQILASAARTADLTTGSGIAPPYGWKRAIAVLDITSITGTGSLNVYLQHSPDGGTNWYDFGAFEQFVGTAAVKFALEFAAGSGNSDVAYQLVSRQQVAGTANTCRWPELVRAVSTHVGYTSVTWSVQCYWE